MSRLLFIGMWNFCDDGGNHPASAKTLKAEIFPADDITSTEVSKLIEELKTNGLLLEYEIEGRVYWHVTGWHHQKIDQPTFKHPMPDGSIPEGAPKRRSSTNNSTNTPRTFAEHSTNTPRTFEECSPPERKGEEGKGVEWSKPLPTPSGVGGEISPEISPLLPVDNSEIETKANGKHRLICPYKRILELYDQHLPMCPRVMEWTETRKKHLSALWHRKASELGWKEINEGIEYFDGYFEFVARSPFLTGKVDGRNGKPPFVANLEWLVTPSRFANVVEGKYHA